MELVEGDFAFESSAHGTDTFLDVGKDVALDLEGMSLACESVPPFVLKKCFPCFEQSATKFPLSFTFLPFSDT